MVGQGGLGTGDWVLETAGGGWWGCGLDDDPAALSCSRTPTPHHTTPGQPEIQPSAWGAAGVQGGGPERGEWEVVVVG